ncbi:MAG TPA: phosphodiesterase [Burkholderiaceae bacterium]|nr:phosphodiesterase [Burkholderiaceae bacterium]HPE01328.1 phosphodiesterase [Burkholderiaceae bacterium]
MLLCQISDPHLVPPGRLAYGRVDTPAKLERCVHRILSLPRRPDAVVATGDLTDHATAEEYGLLAELLAPLTMPVYLLPGNHDERGALQAAFPRMPWLRGEDGFVQYAVDDLEVRLVVLDTVVPGEPGGALCARRLAWLDRTLAESDRPTIVAQHHPPIAAGMTLMDSMRLAHPEEQAAVIARHPHVERVIAGHYHRAFHARFAGTVASVCPSTAHQLVADLRPEAGMSFAFEPSAFQLHLWTDGRLVTHTQVIDDFPGWGERD